MVVAFAALARSAQISYSSVGRRAHRLRHRRGNGLLGQNVRGRDWCAARCPVRLNTRRCEGCRKTPRRVVHHADARGFGERQGLGIGIPRRSSTSCPKRFDDERTARSPLDQRQRASASEAMRSIDRGRISAGAIEARSARDTGLFLPERGSDVLSVFAGQHGSAARNSRSITSPVGSIMPSTNGLGVGAFEALLAHEDVEAESRPGRRPMGSRVRLLFEIDRTFDVTHGRPRKHSARTA